MLQININQAKLQLSELIEEAIQGEEIIIAKEGEPIARLVAFEKPKRKPRVAGSMKGQIKMSDDFDAPMSDENLALWYDAPVFPT